MLSLHHEHKTICLDYLTLHQLYFAVRAVCHEWFTFQLQNSQFWRQTGQKSALQEILQIFTSHLGLHTQCNSIMTRVRTLIGSGNILHVILHSSAIYKHVMPRKLNLCKPLLILAMITVLGHSANCEFIQPNVLLQVM